MPQPLWSASYDPFPAWTAVFHAHMDQMIERIPAPTPTWSVRGPEARSGCATLAMPHAQHGT